MTPRRRRRRLVTAPVATAASGNTSWTLNTSGQRCAQATSRPVTPIVSGGDMAMTASARSQPTPGGDAAAEGERRETGEPERPPDEVALVLAGERIDPGDRSPRAVSCRPISAGHPGSTRCWRYHGQRRDDVEVVAAGGELLDDPRHDPPSRCRVGFEVRAQHDEAHGHDSFRRRGGRRWPAPLPDAATVNRAARWRPRATSSSRRAATLARASAHSSTVGGSTTAASPATSGRAARSLQTHRRAEGHRLEHRSAEAFVLRREHERLGEGDQPIAIGGGDPARSDDPLADAERRDRRPKQRRRPPRRRRAGRARGPGRPTARRAVDEQPVALVWMGDRRVDDDASITESIAAAQLVGRRQRRRRGGS